MNQPDLFEMKVLGLAKNDDKPIWVVVLGNEEENDLLPIWIGPFEAQAIEIALQGLILPRPMTHDLLKLIIDSVEAKLERIIINKLDDSTFFAQLDLTINGEAKIVDSRPSDAIALALRLQAPILVDKRILKDAGISSLLSKDDKLQEWLEDLKPEDFGDYKM